MEQENWGNPQQAPLEDMPVQQPPVEQPPIVRAPEVQPPIQVEPLPPIQVEPMTAIPVEPIQVEPIPEQVYYAPSYAPYQPGEAPYQPGEAQYQPVEAPPELQEPPAPSPKKKGAGFRVFLIVLAVALIIGGLGTAAFRTFLPLTPPTVERPEGGTPELITMPDNLENPSENELSVQVAKKVLPSVVSITATVEMSDMFMGNMEQESSGAGVILKSDGYIVTNNHVVQGARSLKVLAGDQTYEAALVGTDPSTDLAVLKIDAKDMPAIELGTSKDLLAGQYVMAVGSPFGHEKSVSAGIISGLGRSDIMATEYAITSYADMIQTDAAINPGNSGGALVDRDGRLIGINSIINSTSGSSAGVGFAIPVDTVIEIANQLIQDGVATHAYLGIGTQTITPEIARAYGFPVEHGVVVNMVVEGSPAEDAGLLVGDIIVKIGDREISSSEEVFSAIRSNRAGDSIDIDLYRNGTKRTVKATLGSDEVMRQQQSQD